MAAAACVVTGSAAAALYGGGPAEAWTTERIAKLSTTVTARITAFGASFGAAMMLKHQQLMSAIAVATAQEGLAGHTVAEAARTSAQQLGVAMSMQRQSEQLARAVMDYSASGQGANPCSTLYRTRTLDGAFNASRGQAQAVLAALDVAPGRLVPGREALAARLARHRAYFCTPAEAQAGFCTVGELPGGDTDAALLFEPADPGSARQRAQMAYIENVLGPPDEALDPAAGATPAGQQYLAEKNRKDALLSIPAYSLASIQSANTRQPQWGGRTPNEVLSAHVNGYFGGPAATQWAQQLAGQTERGLSVEAVKLDALLVWMRHQQYLQNQRIEMNLAALALAVGEEEEAGVRARHSAVVASRAKGQLR